MNNEELKSKTKFSIIISLICLILEIISKGTSITFWVILLSCNISIMLANISNYRKM